MSKTALVTGAGGFIGGHLVRRLLDEDTIVFAVDSKPKEEWWQAHEGNPYNPIRYYEGVTQEVLDGIPTDIDEVYHLAADMGGIGYIETHKLACTLSTEIDIAVARWALKTQPGRLFYSSSACVYPQYRQLESNVEPLAEWMAWPAEPEDGYGVQKLYTEELMRHLYTDAGVETRVARYHNVYGPHGTWDGGREKAPAALCRKIATAKLTGDDHIKIWGDGDQTRSFLFINDCVEGTLRLTRSAVGPQPLNIGSEYLVTINELARIIMKVADVDLEIVRVPGYLGVRGRTSDNVMIRSALGWEPSVTLEDGLTQTYAWVEKQVKETLWNAEPRATG